MHGVKSLRIPALAGAGFLALLIAFPLTASVLLAAPAAKSVGKGPRAQIIVKFKDQGARRGALAREILQAVSARLGRTLKPLRDLGTGAVLVDLEKGENRSSILAELAARADVEYAEPDLLLQALATPNDTRYYEQWGHFEETGGLNLPGAWDATRGAGAVVAVLDTGVTAHADLAANLLPGYDMISSAVIANDGNGRDADASDPGDWTDAGECGANQPPVSQKSSWHGTHVAGILAAVSDNNAGVAGVAGQAGVVPVRVLGKCGGYTSDIADGILWAAGLNVGGAPANPNPAQVINLSLGGSGSCSRTLQEAIDRARGAGVTVVVAAGNANSDAANSNPANCNGVVAVAAVDRDGGKAYYSNFGSIVDLAAPGGDMRYSPYNGILSPLNSGTTGPAADSYAFYQGTSMAAPHVAGLAALLYSLDPSLSPARVEATLVATARAFPGTCAGCGAGIADAAAAVAALTGAAAADTLLQNGVAVPALAGAQGAELHFSLDVPAGATGLSFQISGGSGDADLYVKFGGPPTTSSWDYRPYRYGNDETVTVATVREGTYHLMLRGYSAFSGVTLVGRFESGNSPAAFSCPAGYVAYTGSLAGTGRIAYEPASTYYYSADGTHDGLLHGPPGTDFNLYLWKWSGSSWQAITAAEGSSADESLSYTGSSGYYTWRIESRSGGGDYTFCLARP